MKLRAKIALGLGGLFVALQVVPVDRTNPPVTGEIQAPAEVKGVLKRACWDCHSNETVWPWYARVAPVSFLVRHHVKDGRRHLNFSEWAGYTPERKAKKFEECGKEVSEGKMPMTSYVLLHPEAQLTDAEKKSLAAWAGGAVND
ncbi:MAG: heme-binding domain-containing protein [Myxococcales bacterium]|nr:heme-binding domain-containing protein [Myxococcales bacterium]